MKMIRTKFPPKKGIIMIRTKFPLIIKRNTSNRITHFFGGHLPHPPLNCERKEFSFVYQGITWLDLSICHKCSQIKNCERRIEHLLKLKNERIENARNKQPEKRSEKDSGTNNNRSEKIEGKK